MHLRYSPKVPLISLAPSSSPPLQSSIAKKTFSASCKFSVRVSGCRKGWVFPIGQINTGDIIKWFWKLQHVLPLSTFGDVSWNTGGLAGSQVQTCKKNQGWKKMPVVYDGRRREGLKSVLSKWGFKIKKMYHSNKWVGTKTPSSQPNKQTKKQANKQWN